MIEQNGRELEPHTVPKPMSSSNISKKECFGSSSVENREDIIKPADKGGAVVAWHKDLCTFQVERQCSDAMAYTEVHHDPTEEIFISISHAAKN